MKNTFALFSLMLLGVSSVAFDVGFSFGDILLVSSVLIAAVKDDDLPQIKELLDGNEDVDQTDNDGKTALIHAAANGQNDAVKLLINYEPTVDQTDKYGKTALMYAVVCSKSDVAELVVKLLINYKANVNYANKNDGGFTALIMAALQNNSDIVKILIKHGAHVNTTDNTEHTALMRAAITSQSNAAEALLCYDANGGQDLMYAVARNTKYFSEVAIKLLEYNVNVNYQDENGNTVLMKAVENEQSKVMEELFKKKADPSTTNNEGENAWDYAKDEQTREILNKYKYS